MTFTKVTKDQIKDNKRNKRGRHNLYNDLMDFLRSRYKYAKVEDDYFNNNNDLRRAIQYCIEFNNLPIAVFMKNGITYIERL